MLRLENVLGEEVYDEESSTFSIRGGITIELEHSLVSVSKWESKYERPFLGEDKMTPEEAFVYIQLMITNGEVPLETIRQFTQDEIDQIQAYIGSKQTATWFTVQKNQPPSREKITAELIYFWMLAHEIPFECQYWHLNKLITLIRVCNLKKSDKKKRSPKEIAAHNRQLNAQRRAQYGTNG